MRNLETVEKGFRFKEQENMKTLGKWLEARKFITVMDEKYGKAYLGVATQLDQKINKMTKQGISRR